MGIRELTERASRGPRRPSPRDPGTEIRLRDGSMQVNSSCGVTIGIDCDDGNRVTTLVRAWTTTFSGQLVRQDHFLPEDQNLVNIVGMCRPLRHEIANHLKRMSQPRRIVDVRVHFQR